MNPPGDRPPPGALLPFRTGPRRVVGIGDEVYVQKHQHRLYCRVLDVTNERYIDRWERPAWRCLATVEVLQ